jgi:hypothetical protein
MMPLTKIAPLARLGVSLACSVLVALLARPAEARSQGAPFSTCTGCHGTGNYIDDAISLDHDGILEGGVAATFTLTITDSQMASAGFFLSATNEGTLELISGEPAKLTGEDLTHNAPIPVSGGRAQVRFRWTPPVEPGGVDFQVHALATNGNGNAAGDRVGENVFSFVWGCEGVVLYVDNDRDGFGTLDWPTSLDCAPRDGWATEVGDCSDNRADVYPGAPERCNERDDDCDQEVDEDLVPQPLYPDNDGDGYGTSLLETIMGCTEENGYVFASNDCDDNDDTTYPDAEEICDGRDNNCDGRVDEDARSRCGVGWCQRIATTCSADSCIPGTPLPETCNYLDDDCDGIVDNDAPCDPGQTCYGGRCILAEDATALTELADDGEASSQAPSATTADASGGAQAPDADGSSTDTNSGVSQTTGSGSGVSPGSDGSPLGAQDDAPSAASGDAPGVGAPAADPGAGPSSDSCSASPSRATPLAWGLTLLVLALGTGLRWRRGADAGSRWR